MKKIKFSIEDESIFLLDSKDPIIQKMVIDALVHNGIEVPVSVRDFDPDYPYFGWKGHSKYCDRWRDTVSLDYPKLPLEEFIGKFACMSSYKMKLNDTYEAVVDLDEQVVKVGCQTFDFETVRALAELTKKKIK